MIGIDFPPYHPNIKSENSRDYIFDEVRKAWVALTPEEWVRQNFLQYLTRVQGFPAALIAVEKAIQLGELTKRFDIVLFNQAGKPVMIIECKAMEINLDQKVLDQVLRYNINLQVPYLVITNGQYCFAFENKEGQLVELSEFPTPSWPGFVAANGH